MKAKFLIASFILPLCLLAAEKAPEAKLANDSKETQIIADMKVFEDAVNTIQKGFLYGNKEMLEKGVKDLKAGNKMAVLKEQLPSYLPTSKKALYKNAYKEGTKINIYADEMMKAMEEKRFSDAYADYAKILNSCNTCHLIIRGWK